MKTTIKQAVKIMFMISVLSISFSCKKESAKQKTEVEKQETTTEITPENKKEKSTPLILEDTPEKVNAISVNTTNNIKSTLDFPVIVQDFIKCKSNATERSDCRNEITKVISETHGISEFKNAKQEYVIYDSIQPIVKKSTQWKNIGVANNQEVLDKALEHANNKGLALIIDTSESYGHVVMVVPGEAQKSGSWALNLPPVLSLLNYKPELSFHDKSLSYAMKKSDDLHVFIRE